MFSSTRLPEIFSVNGRDMIMASDAARLASFSTAYITRLCRNGKLAGARLTSGWFVDEILFRQFLADRAAKPSPPSTASRMTIEGVTFVRPRDVARTVNLGPDYICRLCRDGFVDGRLVSGTWFVNRESLRVFLVDQKRQKKESRVALSLLRRLEQRQ
jgi:hypothetical protein